jgi:hypothetical protein
MTAAARLHALISAVRMSSMSKVLRRDSKRPLAGAPTGEFRQDGGVHMKPYALQAPDLQRSHSPFVLEPAELPLSGTPRAVELHVALALAGD